MITACIVLAAVSCAAFLRDYSATPDLAHHYSFTEELFRQLRWPIAQAPSMAGGMNHYPPVAHFLAGLAGLALGSSLVGIYLVVSFAILCSLFLTVKMVVNGRDTRSASLSVAVLIVIAFGCSRGKTFVGHEIIQNFFFAQAVGHTFVIAGIAELNRLGTYRLDIQVLAMSLAVAFVTSVYMLSGIQLAAGCLAFLALPILRGIDWRRMLAVTAFAPVSLLILATHPSFWESVSLASGEGWISISMKSVTTASGLLAAGLIAAIALYLKTELRPWYRPAISLGVAALAPFLLQALALTITGTGSSYVLRKHGFLLGTSAAILWTCIVVEVALRLNVRRFPLELPSHADRSFYLVLPRYSA